jgi:hypothetical protein
LLNACTATPSPVTDTRTFTPTANITFPEGHDLMYGELRPATITVTNSTFDPVVFRSVQLKGQLPFVYRSPEPLAGMLKFEEVANRFVYNSTLNGETDSLFADNMLLLPGESLTVEQHIRLRFFQQKATILFQRVPMRDLLADVYFPTPDPHHKNQILYRNFRHSELNVYRNGSPGTLERVVILPDSAMWPMEECENEVRINIRDNNTPATIVETIGANTWSPVTAWTRADLWIVDDPQQENTVAVREDGSTFPLPRCDLRIFDVLDRAGDDDNTVLVYASALDDRPERVHAMAMLDTLDEVRTADDELHPRWAEREDGTYFYGLLRMTPARAPAPTPTPVDLPK